MLEKRHLEYFIHTNKEKKIAEDKVFDRVSEVIRVVHKAFGIKLDNLAGWSWWFSDANEGEVGTLLIDYRKPDTIAEFQHDDAEILYVYQNWDANAPDRSDMETKCWDYAESFRAVFLLMTNDEIIDFITRERGASNV